MKHSYWVLAICLSATKKIMNAAVIITVLNAKNILPGEYLGNYIFSYFVT